MDDDPQYVEFLCMYYAKSQLQMLFLFKQQREKEICLSMVKGHG
jgi:hypothetical protein